MPTIAPMAVITIVVALLLWGGMLWAYSGRTWRYLAFLPLGLPLSAIVNLLVKGPLAEWVGARAGIAPKLGLATPVWFLLFLFLLSPVFEELIKVAPALVPSVRRAAAEPDGAFWTGMALGIGFGIGEAAYLAWGIGSSGAYDQYAWYMFGGFLSERLFVTFFHGLMTALFLWFVARRRPLLGFLAAAGSHALINSTAMLYQLKLVPGWVPSLTLVVLLIGAVLLFEKIRPRPAALGRGHAETVHYTREA